MPKYNKWGTPTFPTTSGKSWTDGLLKDYPPDFIGRKAVKVFYPDL